MNKPYLFGLFLITFYLSVMLNNINYANAQVSSIDLPVELVGFPIITAAVRISNFVKKLAYSLNPKTYSSRSRRSIQGDEMINIDEAEKRLIGELGNNVCIYHKVCLHHAEKSKQTNGENRQNIDWDDIFRHYKSPTEKHKEYYILSVFLGDIVGSTKLCNQLAKRGRACID